ncbi:YciI family protein [Agromyces humi]|uniref:YciI family protein n=1 Tax=Agromyces humi TaxID=1766800 RepID=UPI0013571F60|nr:YciI family protein [Agromyces humi]
MEIMMFVVADPDVDAGDVDQGVVAEWDRVMAERGVLKRAMRLRPADEAKTVRVRGGEVLVTDGPFTESKEWIAGYDLLEVADLDEAEAIAKEDHLARFGALELRPVWPIGSED